MLANMPEIRFEPFWWQASPPPRPSAQPVSTQCDVVVVGAGYTGLSAAHTLAGAGRSVQVFDKQRAGEGASTRNGGILSGNIRISLSKCIEKFGKVKAVAMYREASVARDHLLALIRDNKIDCDLQMSGRFTGALCTNDYDTMAREADLLRTHTGIEVHAVAKNDLSGEIGSPAYSGGVVRPDIGMFHPAKFHAALLKLATVSGAKVHSETPVVGIRKDANEFEVQTNRGTVRARDIIIATNGYTDASNRWLRRRLVPVTSRIVVTKELSANLMCHLMPKGRAMGEMRHLYRYFRPSPDGKRIMIGGREPVFTNDPHKSAEHVRQGLASIFPELANVEISHSWAGNVAFSLDDLPRLFSHDGMHYAVGYCGSGTVWAPYLGMKAAQKILDTLNSESTFDCKPPRALPFYSGRPWFLPAAMVYFGYKDRQRTNSKSRQGTAVD